MKSLSSIALIAAILSMIVACYVKLANIVIVNTSAGGFLELSSTLLLLAIAIMLYTKKS